MSSSWCICNPLLLIDIASGTSRFEAFRLIALQFARLRSWLRCELRRLENCRKIDDTPSTSSSTGPLKIFSRYFTIHQPHM